MNYIEDKLAYLCSDDFYRAPGFAAYNKKYGMRGTQRFWKLFREDLMRVQPENLLSFLRDENSKLAECRETGDEEEPTVTQNLVKEHNLETASMEELLQWQEALILFCLEQDAAWKLHTMQNKEVDKGDLQNKLDCLGVI